MASGETARVLPDASTEEFRAEWQKLGTICQALGAVDLEKLRRTVEQAETVMPILDPSAYRAGSNNLANQRRVLEAALRLRDTFSAVIESEGGRS